MPLRQRQAPAWGPGNHLRPDHHVLVDVLPGRGGAGGDTIELVMYASITLIERHHETTCAVLYHHTSNEWLRPG